LKAEQIAFNIGVLMESFKRFILPSASAVQPCYVFCRLKTVNATIRHTALLVFATLPLLAQTRPDTVRRPNSPVFKDYRTNVPTPVIEQSDATYQLWQSFRVLQEANAGNAVSQFELSIRYLTGRGFTADTVKAAYWTKKAAEQNHLLARYNLGIFQFNGWGTEWNPFEAYRNFRFAAERNMPEAQFALAQVLTENLVVPQNWPEAYRWTKRAADSGYAPAKEALRFFEQRGYGSSSDAHASTTEASRPSVSSAPSPPQLQVLFLDFSPDTLQATPDSLLVDDVLKAAADSVVRSLHSIRVSRSRIEMDATEHAVLLRAADAGSPEALTLLGRCYEQGVSCPADPILAAKYYVRAVRMDSRRASRLLYHLLEGQNFFTLLKARVGQSDPDAQYVWACLIALGFDRQLTEGQALHMLESAAAASHVPSLIELGLAYYAGRWVQRAEHKALELWTRAEALGSREAAVRIAILAVRRGNENVEAAVRTLQSAAQLGSVLAEFALAFCYETGRGVVQNKGEAARLYRTSAQRGSQDAYRALIRMHDEIRPKEKEFVIAN
jgi:TPR repeat protein